MAEGFTTVRQFDPSGKAPEGPRPLELPPRTVNLVHRELMRGIVQHLGNHPALESLLQEFEQLTSPPLQDVPEVVVDERTD